jgi:hypothetical protein
VDPEASPADVEARSNGTRSDRVGSQELLAGLSAFLQPASAVLFALALWRLGADLGLAGRFVFSDGLLSHWQLWFAGAAAVQGLAWILNRRAGGSGDKESAA